MHRRGFLIAASAALAGAGLAACGPPTLTPEQAREIAAGRKSGILMSFEAFEDKYFAHLTLMNVETERETPIYLYGGLFGSEGAPNVVAVDPGRYRLWDGRLVSDDSSGDMPLLRFWFDEVEVAPGEVVDIGTLTVSAIRVRSQGDSSGQAVSALRTLDRNDTTTYLVYEMADSDPARVERLLAERLPGLAGEPIRRTLAPALDRTRFEQVIAEAYEVGPDGELPSTEELRSRLDARLSRLVRRSLRAAEGEAPRQ